MFQTLCGRHPAATVLHQKVGDEVLKRISARLNREVAALCLFTLALADIGSNSGSSKSKRTLSCKEHINSPRLAASPECDLWCDLLDNIAEGLGVCVPHEGRES